MKILFSALLLAVAVCRLPLVESEVEGGSSSSSSLDKLSSAIGVITFITNAWNQHFAHDAGFKLPDLSGRDAISQMLQDHGEVMSKLNQFDSQLDEVQQMLKVIQAQTRVHVRWEMTIDTLENCLLDIKTMYKLFEHYHNQSSSIEQSTLLDFANNAVSSKSTSISSAMHRMTNLAQKLQRPRMSLKHGLRAFHLKKGLFGQLKERIEVSDLSMCGSSQSPQQLAISIYLLLVIALSKGFVMMEFAYVTLSAFHKGNFTVESRNAESDYIENNKKIREGLDSVLGKLDNVYWRCDPAEYRLGLNYEQVTNLVQAYVVNEETIDHKGSCTTTCGDKKNVKDFGCQVSTPICRYQRNCRGRVFDCRFYNYHLDTCVTIDDDTRRYEWIKYGDKTMGVYPGRNQCRTFKVKSWLRLFVQCHYCVCMCDQEENSDRYFSLLREEADLANNYVVTGVRWIKRNGVFYLQIQQGILKEFGVISPHTVFWKPITPVERVPAGHVSSQYTTLTYHYRHIRLDDVPVIEGHVVTGLALSEMSHANGATYEYGDEIIYLKVKSCGVNFTTGVLSGSCHWSDYLTTEGSPLVPKDTYLNKNVAVSTKSDKPNRPDVGRQRQLNGQMESLLMKFEPSSMEDDVAQSTLPFIDIQPVAPNPPVLLTGLGLYLRSSTKYGGFLAPRVFSIDPVKFDSTANHLK